MKCKKDFNALKIILVPVHDFSPLKTEIALFIIRLRLKIWLIWLARKCCMALLSQSENSVDLRGILTHNKVTGFSCHFAGIEKTL